MQTKMSVDTLFNELASGDVTNQIISRFEGEFKSLSIEEKSRVEEEEVLKADIRKLNKQLRKYKNIKNRRLAHLNAKRAEKRKEIRKKITEKQMRLKEIQDEREGNEKYLERMKHRLAVEREKTSLDEE